MNYIDAHSHIWTPDTAHYPLAAGFRRANMQPPSFTVEELQAQMKPAGVNRVVLIQMSFYGYDNDYMLDTIERFPDQFVGVAVIDQNAQDPEIRMGRLQKQGVTGFRIYPKDQPVERWLDNEGLRKMFAFGAKRNLNMCCLIDTDALPSLDKTCREFPDTPVVIDHLCRIGTDGKIREAEVRALCDMAVHKNVTVKVSAFYALGKKTPPYKDLGPMIRQVYDAYGPERLMWATDCPFQVVDHTYLQSIELIEKQLDFLTADDREWILRKTAERVFFRS
ncbi:4-sulfomuconolactone hydrolase [Symmachiella dynata]|uniref:amidohydrolase family protein n=1 Tax=Symmachiella dynata TaxID=2527995 RepID=UPI00118B954D|nr:amidohydrolase family protein [Symmachiella dynata]QDT51099.1 4-sulfomuconolactone hydrolase [Symmachiella dynata]